MDAIEIAAYWDAICRNTPQADKLIDLRASLGASGYASFVNMEKYLDRVNYTDSILTQYVRMKNGCD
jgi:hypothetical protein